MIRAVTIDAHGVLLLPDPEAIRAVLKEFSCEPDDATCWRAHYQMMRILDQMTHDDWPFMNRSFAQALRVRQSAQDDAGAILAEKVYLGTSWIPAPGASSALARLIAHGHGVAVISNTSWRCSPIAVENRAVQRGWGLCACRGHYRFSDHWSREARPAAIPPSSRRARRSPSELCTRG